MFSASKKSVRHLVVWAQTYIFVKYHHFGLKQKDFAKILLFFKRDGSQLPEKHYCKLSTFLTLHVKICWFGLKSPSCGGFKHNAGHPEGWSIFTFFNTWTTHKKLADYEQHYIYWEKKCLLRGKWSGNHMLVPTNTQLIVKTEHVEIVWFPCHAKFLQFCGKNPRFGSYWVPPCANMGK